MPHKDNENCQSPMLTYWPEINEKYNNENLVKKWKKIEELKELVAKKLELARTEKIIGHSLNAKVTLYAEGENYKFLKDVENQLQTVFIVSGVAIEENARKDEEEKIGVKVETADGQKCERCWMYSTTVGEDKENPTICHKCSQAIR